jgi:sterol desaturase/sphingolipid hydroxylase (fatty acid hydroxylase superfamily)
MSSELQTILVLCIIAGFIFMELATRRYQATVTATADDTKLEFLMFLSLVAVCQPLALLSTNALGEWAAPGYRDALVHLPWWGMVAILLVGDDLTQYLWHRASHSALLWPLHRAHHTAQYMSIRVTYRNNFFYYLMMPGLWIAGVLTFLGFGPVYAAYGVVKLLVIMGAHSAWRWDEPLYRIRALRPLMWLVERTISTPATHWAHHALTNADGVGHYTGNFGNLLFVWDLIFGTAHITRRYPARVGLQDDLLHGQERWYHQIFYPLLQSKRANSALRSGGRTYAAAETSADGPAGHTTP